MADRALQDRVVITGVEVFGEQNVRSDKERLCRFLEEAIEMVRAGGLADDQIYRIISFEMNRPVGKDLAQEIGGACATLLAYADSRGFNALTCVEGEIERILRNKDYHRAKHEAKPVEVRA